MEPYIGAFMYGVGMLGMGIWIGVYGKELLNDYINYRGGKRR